MNISIGKFTLHSINTGYLKLDGGGMFGIIPKPLWEKYNNFDSRNRVLLAARILLLTSSDRNILVDTGCGHKWNGKMNDLYDFTSENLLEESLKKLNLTRHNITDVIFTHLHFDHAGGSTYWEDGKLLPYFPNAQYYVQKQNYDWAVNPTELDKSSYLKENFTPLFDTGLLNLLSPGQKIDDNIDLEVLNGHTIGQQLVKISDDSSTLLFCADLIPFCSHINLPYIMSYDLQPLLTLLEKKKFLDLAYENNWYLFLEHDPLFEYITIDKKENKFIVKNSYADNSSKFE
ncbi:MAG: MBL fold metallo-hydrolase [Bacteroidota bacterium]|nr:MBL fold metallo-hydrolase [Bacteroidota bacterium]